MSTFTFDTSGTVNGLTFDALPGFAQGYLEAAAREAWTALDQTQRDRLDHFGPIAFSDFAPDTVKRALADCGRASTPSLCHVSDGRRFWERRQDGTAGPDFPPLTLSIVAEDGLLHMQEVAR